MRQNTLTSSQAAIQQHYAEVAEEVTEEVAEIAASGSCSADRGCGKPLERAALQPGEVVLDLGCGAGSELLAAAAQVGESGQVFGLDMTPQMLALAQSRVEQAGFSNIKLLPGLIENIPLADASVDVVISNCVLNLCDDKPRALAEAARVLRPAGRLCIADIILVAADLPLETRRLTAPILGCTNGVLTTAEYLAALAAAGFSDASVEPYRPYAARTLLQRAEQRGHNEALAHLSSTIRQRSVDNAFAAANIQARK
ncbi:MAG: methyltransferase domain-containing protein [Coriobacteriales bacterium]|nr:methyltransferase domain-containing protein [Coriobacteriales bacterium]